MPSTLIERFRQLEREMSSAIAAGDGAAVSALDGALTDTWKALLGAETGDPHEKRRLVDFFLGVLADEDGSRLHGEARARIMALFDADTA